MQMRATSDLNQIIQTERSSGRHSKAHARLRVKDRTLVSLIVFLLTAAVNYSPRVVLQRWTWGLWDKGTGGGRWNYKILMMELWLNGNFLNWFWRGAQKEPTWRDTETGGGRGLLFHFQFHFLSFSGHVPAFLTSGLTCFFIPCLNSITKCLSFCFNFFHLIFAVPLHSSFFVHLYLTVSFHLQIYMNIISCMF